MRPTLVGSRKKIYQNFYGFGFFLFVSLSFPVEMTFYFKWLSTLPMDKPVVWQLESICFTENNAANLIAGVFFLCLPLTFSS
jgi:hypothetical protein